MRLASLVSAIAPIVFLSPDNGTPAGGAPPADAPPAEPDFTRAAGSFLGLDDEPAQDSTPASDAADTVVADDASDTVVADDKDDTVAGDDAADTVAGAKDDTSSAKEPAKAPEKPAEAAPVADPLKPIVEQMSAAEQEYRAAEAELNAGKAELAEARKAIRELPTGELIDRDMMNRQLDAEDKIIAAQAKMQEAGGKYNAAHQQREQTLTQIRDTGRQLWAKEHAELADSPAEVLKTADKMYESILADVAKDPRYRTPEAQQAVALDRLETKVRQTIDGKKAAAKPPATPPQRKPHASTQVRPTGAPLKGGTGSTKTGEMEVSMESVEKLLGL